MSFYEPDHISKNNTTYTKHMWKATKITFQLLLAGLCCFVHIFIPFIFADTATKLAKNITDKHWRG